MLPADVKPGDKVRVTPEKVRLITLKLSQRFDKQKTQQVFRLFDGDSDFWLFFWGVLGLDGVERSTVIKPRSVLTGQNSNYWEFEQWCWPGSSRQLQAIAMEGVKGMGTNNFLEL